MRIWSLNPVYLDPKGLVALWRESLLALAVLSGATKGYRHHPQLKRFLATRDPVNSIRCYLWFVYLESEARGYHFDRKKIGSRRTQERLRVTAGQLRYELEHLKGKLKVRDPSRYEVLLKVGQCDPHPLFDRMPGDIEEWERDNHGRKEAGHPNN
jgi:hypothetical protein